MKVKNEIPTGSVTDMSGRNVPWTPSLCRPLSIETEKNP